MTCNTSRISFGVSVVLSAALVVSAAKAFEEPARAGVGQKVFRLSELEIESRYLRPGQLPAQAAARAAADLAVLGASANAGLVDRRSGRWASVLLSEPVVPGRGRGNKLSWSGLGLDSPANDAELGQAASRAVRAYLEAAGNELRIDTAELDARGKTTVSRNGAVIQIYLPRVFNGIPVRGSYVTVTVNNGNMTLFGAHNWGDIQTSTTPLLTADDAMNKAQSHASPYPVNGAWGAAELALVPVAKVSNPDQVQVGTGYDYRLAWVTRPSFDGDAGRYEALVDAHSGELLSFEDTNHYAATARESRGGVFPVSNDGALPDGVEQAGWPMPFDNVATPGGTVTTDAGGNLPAPVDGNITSTLSGEYVDINDYCGAISLTSSGDLDFGTSGGTDCITPGFGGAGNTHSSRTGFHELNRIIEMGRGQLPSNTWLQGTLIAYMNINANCNAYWNGTVNFYTSGGGCANTGELAGVFDHEWGHGLDANDATPGIASPSGEGIADVYMALRLNTSCIGRGFRMGTNCSGNGDPCLSCDGVRDIDYLQHASGNPHDYSWANAACGGQVHCVGHVYSEAVWSLWKRELQSAPYNYDDHTAHEIVTRLTYIGAGNTGTWFSGGPPNGGCAANSGYMNYLAADDNNGNLNDGTPHMTAIYNAFNDQEIACNTPTVQDSGCAGTPATAPVVSASPADKSVNLSWGAVADASSYEVFRTDGVHNCDFGKFRAGETTDTSFSDTGLQNGRDYSYVVIPKGPAAACFGPASVCATATPVAGPNADIDPASAALSTSTGDADGVIDNCEEASLTFEVANTGLGDLTNVRITGVTVVSPPGTTIDISFPAPVAPSTLAQGASGLASFDFTAGGLSFGDTLVFEVEFTTDELASPRNQTLELENAESDIQSIASKTWDFETDLEGWTVIDGTFNQTTTGGGANGSAGYVASSSLLHNQCDQVRSPEFQLTTTSTLAIESNYDIEAESSPGVWWDRANVALFGNGRDAVSPDGGRLYNASGPGATCATTGQDGWADTNNTWGSSSWSATALDAASRAGQSVQIDIAYGTDVSVVGTGFWFDQVTVTDIEMLIADVQTDSCGGGGNTPPVVTITAPANGSSFTDGDSIGFAGTANDSEQGDLSTSLNWHSHLDGDFGAGASFNTSSLSVGTHTVTASVTDGGGLSGDDQITVTVDPLPPSGDTHVVQILTGTQSTQGTKNATASVTVHDQNGTAVGAGYTVTGDFSGTINESDAVGVTDGNGIATVISVGTATKKVDVFFCVSDVSGTLPYDPGDNSDPGFACAAGGPLTDVHVENIATGTQGVGGGQKRGTATVTVLGDDGLPQAGYTVIGNFSGTFGDNGLSEVTDGNGVAAFETAGTNKGKTEVSFCVANVSGGAVPYDPSDNADPAYACAPP